MIRGSEYVIGIESNNLVMIIKRLSSNFLFKYIVGYYLFLHFTLFIGILGLCLKLLLNKHIFSGLNPFFKNINYCYFLSDFF